MTNDAKGSSVDPGHDRELALAFDGQAERFEKAPVQSDPAALQRLVAFARLKRDSLVLDAGCGPGLVSSAFLSAGHRIVGCDLSAEMISRATIRCSRFGDRARFVQRSIFEEGLEQEFDAAVSRYVLHHVVDPLGFLRRQLELLKTGGVLVLCDHSTDANDQAAERHQAMEIGRDKTHTRNLTPGQAIDLLAELRLIDLSFEEEAFTLDFDEWFDRGTPSLSKAEVRGLLLSAGPIRGFEAREQADGGVIIHCVRSLIRGVKP